MKDSIIVTRADVESGNLDTDLVEALREHFAKLDAKPTGLLKAIKIFEDALKNVSSSVSPLDGRCFAVHRALRRIAFILNQQPSFHKKFRSAAHTLINKIILKTSLVSALKRKNVGAFVCLLVKLKPTSDGKDAALASNKAAQHSFFIRTGALDYDRFENQAFA